MRLRIYFEPHKKMCINDSQVFEYYGGNYLGDFDARFGGYISMNLTHKRGDRFEPVWQFLMENISIEERNTVLEYIDENPMNGYYVHVYEESNGRNAVKVL